jgi:Rrf2 family protein
MKKSTTFSDMLHVLLHLAHSTEPATSMSLAKAMRTNPVVVRRTMAGLRKQGLVISEKGHGGGWQLSCNLKKVTLFDVYKAVGSPTMLAIGNRMDSPDCLIEKAVNIATNDAFTEAEKTLIKKLRKTTLLELRSHIRKD